MNLLIRDFIVSSCFWLWHHFLFVCSHRRPLPVDGSVRQHGEGLESPGLDAAEDARRTRGEGTNRLLWLVCSDAAADCWRHLRYINTQLFSSPGDGRRRVTWRETDRHQLLWPDLQTLAVWVMSWWCHGSSKTWQCFFVFVFLNKIKVYILEMFVFDWNED